MSFYFPLTARRSPKRFDPATLSMDGFAKHVTKVLPHYAVPLFIRRLPRIDVTSTFKHLKTELRSEGANPSSLRRDSDGNVPDVWYLTQDRSTYEKLTPEVCMLLYRTCDNRNGKRYGYLLNACHLLASRTLSDCC